MRLSLIKQVFASSLRRSAANASSNVPVEAPGADRVLRKIDLRKEMASLPEAQQMYIKRIIAKNNERYEKEKNHKLQTETDSSLKMLECLLGRFTVPRNSCAVQETPPTIPALASTCRTNGPLTIIGSSLL